MIRTSLFVNLDHRIYRGLLVAWMVFIFYMSSRSSVPMPDLWDGQDKLMHFVTYAIFGFFAARSVRAAGGEMSWRVVVGSAVFSVLYGVSDEVHQSFVPGRDASGNDLIADALGGFAGAWFARRLQHALHSAAGG
jgi:VanZ family protein